MTDSDGSQSSLLKSDSLAAVRLVAGRIVHDFNNLLTPLLAYPQLVRRDLAPDSAARDLLEVMEKTAGDMAFIMSQLATFSQVARAPEAPVCVAGAIRSAVDSAAARGAAQGVEVAVRMADALPDLTAIGAAQLELVISALLANALEAMAEGGQLEVSVREESFASSVETVGRDLPGGGYLVMAVSDTGEGIDGASLHRIFDPFYTTRRQRKVRGSGLGLSIVYALVHDAGGGVAVRSTHGAGSTFTVYLPLDPPGFKRSGSRDETASAAGSASPASDASPATVSRVLVCDDERVIVGLFHLMIDSAIEGVEVDEAANGLEAVELFEAKRHAVIIMDLHMPVMDGQTAFRAIEKLCAERGWPMPVVIFCTGYAPPDGVRRVIDADGRHELLLKPVTGAQLVGAVKTGLHL